MLVCSLPTPLAKISPIDNHQVKYENMQHLMFGNATKLVNAAPHRWISTCKVLEEVLRSWEALEKHYLDNEAGGNFPLAVHKTAIEELYSLMKPVALLIKNSQRSGGPTGLSTFIDLCTLQATTLDLEKPLLITVPRKVRLGEAGSATVVTKRAASSLQAVTTSTRKMLRDAILKRFFNKRYDEAVFAVPEPSYVFEMAACMSPFLHDLKWLPKFCSSPEEADRVDKHIRAKVVDLMVSMAEGAGMQAEERPDSDETTSSNKRKRPAGLFATPSVSKKQDDEQAQRMADSGLFGDDSEGDGDSDNTGPCMAEGAGMQAEERPDSDETTSSNKRKRPAGLFATPSVSKKQDDEQAQRMADSGLFGDDSEGDGDSDNTGPCKLTLREVCQQEFDRFQERFKSTKAKDYPLSVLLSFWAGEGRALYLNMARVARVLLSVPASAVVLERDFSTAGRLITGSRSRLAGEYVEMTLFLNGNKEYIPVEVPSLSESQVKEAVPRRLTNPRAEVAALSTGVEDVVPVVVFDANINDEYAAEATSV